MTTLEPNGTLCMSTIGLGKPGDNFIFISRKEQPGRPFPLVTTYSPISNFLCPLGIQVMGTYEDGPNLTLTIVESDTQASADERHWRRMDAWEHEQQVAYWKGLVMGAWNFVRGAFPPILLASQRLDSNLITPKDLRPGNAVSGVTDIPKSRLVHRQRTAEVGDPEN